jgi:hypothetical protein
VPNPRLATDVATNAAARALEGRRAWEGFLHGGSPPPDLRAPITESGSAARLRAWTPRGRHASPVREEPRTAFGMFTAMGVGAFAGPAERELLAIGERVRTRIVETREGLTAHEARSRDSRATACRTSRSASGRSSDSTPSPTTCARCSPSSASPRATSSTGCCTKAPAVRREGP